MALAFPNIDPVALDLGVIQIRWYGLAYLAAFVIGWLLMRKLSASDKKPIATKAIDDLVIWVTLGVILGGRLGYILFYNIGVVFYDPLAIFKIWQGGMSFHGGLIGVILASWFFCKKHDVPFLKLMDLLAIVAPIGLFFGRIANFINGELFGRMTNHSWGMIFPNGGPYPRHPSQLYEAFLEGILLFAIIISARFIWKDRLAYGSLSGLFLFFYGLFRFTVEFFREPDGYIMIFSRGQFYSLPMILFGAAMVYITFLRKSKNAISD